MGARPHRLTAAGSGPETDALRRWLAARRASSGLECVPITWDEARSWSVEDGAIVHERGAFFSIVGADVGAAGSVDGVTRLPLIRQPEIGILGVLLCRSGGDVRALLHAKTEPGNVRGTQIGPTVQATESNYMQRHLGAETPYLEWFTGRAGDRLAADTLQSEQGTRFLGKRNRNAIAVTGELETPASPSYRWFSARALLDLLHEDFAVNTDLRSVLVCSDWRDLCASGEPFRDGGGPTELQAALRESCCTPAEPPEPALRGTGDPRRTAAGHAAQVPLVPLDALPHWDLRPQGLIHDGEGLFDARLVRVRANDREVAEWDQPLLCNRHTELCTLLCQKRDGVLRFLLRSAVEPGLPGGPELGPTLQHADSAAPGADPVARWLAADERTIEHARVRQSDEGGRFGWCTAVYRLMEAPADSEPGPVEDGVWLTLGEIQALVRRPGNMTNEARSALSLLLYYL